MTRVIVKPTPLELVIGFKVAEETYDMLDLTEQIILDLKIAGIAEADIAKVLGISQFSVNTRFRRVRYALAESKFHQILEARVHYKETHTQVVGEEYNDEEL